MEELGGGIAETGVDIAAAVQPDIAAGMAGGEALGQRMVGPAHANAGAGCQALPPGEAARPRMGHLAGSKRAEHGRDVGELCRILEPGFAQEPGHVGMGRAGVGAN